MSGLSGCLLDGSRLRAFQALWQCFPQAPLVSPHTANIHAAHRRMRVGGRNEEQDYWRGKDGVGVHLLRLGWTNLLAKWLAKWEKRVERGLRETQRGEMGKWLKKAHGHFCKGDKPEQECLGRSAQGWDGCEVGGQKIWLFPICLFGKHDLHRTVVDGVLCHSYLHAFA